MKLGTLLLRNGVIGLGQLESALRNQVLYGGRLGTNLVELGLVDLEHLAGYLSELSGLPIATQELLDAADKYLLDKLSAEDAHRLRAVPLQRPIADPKTIAVAIVEANADNLAQLAERLGASIAPHIVPELRALYYLEKHYGMPRRARFIRSSRPGRPPEIDEERRKSQPAAGIVMPPPLTLEPRKRRASQASMAYIVPIALSYDSACERIESATSRDQIADVFVQYAQGRCDTLAVFIVRDGNALGWRVYVAPPATPTTPFEHVSLPLGGASALQSAHDSCEPFVGAPPSAAKPVETQLWTALGTSPEPIEVIVLPIIVQPRVLNLIYAHSVSTPMDPGVITELSDLAFRAQSSYQRLLRQTRGL